MTVLPVADGYVTWDAPNMVRATLVKLDASRQRGHRKTIFIRFMLSPTVAARVTQANLVLTRTDHHLAGVIYARTATETRWTERTLDAATAPRVGSVLAASAVTSRTNSVILNVTSAARGRRAFTIAVTSSLTNNVATFRSREDKAHPPQLWLTLAPVTGHPRAPRRTVRSNPHPRVAGPVVKGGPVIRSRPVITPRTVAPRPTVTPAITTTACVSSLNGIPTSGAYMGATVSGTADLGTVERQAGETMPIYRDYFRADQVDYAISRVKADLAAKRLPWISFKLPYSWADMAAGRGDAWVTDLANKLANVGGPVWLAFHHEPEGDGPIQDWVRMQRHLAPIIHARDKNVAYTVILSAWDNFFGPKQYALDAIWPGSQYVDILGFDLYNNEGAKPVSQGGTMLYPMQYFSLIEPWAKAHHVKWAIGETGYTLHAAQLAPHWLQTMYTELRDTGGIGLAYFDSSYNSGGIDFTLDDPLRTADFVSAVHQSVRLC